MTEADLGDVLSTWEKALTTLREALDLEVSTIARDAAIKRFEYNFELAWKTVKHFARLEGETCNSPKEALKTALKLNWIEDDKVWLDILDDRNQTTHTYQESTAESVYRNLPGYYEAFVSLHRALTQVLERQ